ncbi:unnamed protein product [Gordionus sp. m RMFG-2023]
MEQNNLSILNNFLDNISIPMEYRHYRDNALSLITNNGLAIFILFMTPVGIFGNLYLLLDLNECQCFCKGKFLLGLVRYHKENVKYYLKAISFSCLVLCLLLLFWPYYYLVIPGCAKENRTFIFAFWFGKMEWFLEETIVCFVNYIIAMMCVDTFLAVRFPFFYRNKYAHSSKTVRIIICLVALYSFLIVVPFIFYFDIIPQSVIVKKVDAPITNVIFELNNHNQTTIREALLEQQIDTLEQWGTFL